ncbi:hypothetical protein L596_024506 [Steinernema carpocapsae]|uniref:Dynein heavy chain linker domain-containing protein n=2 Tax=Steinernema carpocapsae TaxID=34508 RepID=A0A4U5MGX1_STECR|nr:hypothetical protein L596_024506 [Steinernema carpocapsae]
MSGRPTRLVLDGELLSTPPRCLTLEFYGRYSRTIYVTHPVPPLDVNQEMRPTIRKLPGVKRKYFRWYIEDMRKRKEQARILSNYIEDIGFARAWFLLVRELPLEVPHPHFTEHDPITKKVCEECSEWIAATERVAVMMCRAEKYGIQEYKRAFAIAECQKYSKRLEMKPNADIDISNLLRTQIRHHILERNGLLFAWRTAAFEGPITTAELRPNLFSQIESFYDELDQMLFPLLSSSEHKQRQIQIALQQECTKIAFNAIRLYMDTIEKEVELIKVECDIVGNKLVMPVDRIADDLKAPIIEACNSDRIILTSDTVDDILDECVKFVEKYLNIDEISRLDLVKQFNRLVFHSKLTPVMHDAQLLDFVRISRDYLFRLQRVPKTINRALFVVDMTKVWNVLRRRASEIIAESTERICDNFASKLREIHGDLEQFGRSINFRSMDPVAMLSNKAQVMKMTSDFLPKLIMNLLRAIDKMFLYSQVIMFESCDYELMTTVAALRMAIPKQVAEHSAFFDRRIHIFKQFVRTRQTVVVKTISETAEKLKRVLVFYDPKSVDSYLREMRKLQPELQEVARLVHTLNEFEEVLGMTKTDGEEICIQAENLIQIEVLFDWTNRFYVFQRKFMESSRLGAKTVDGKTFLGDFEAVLKISSERIEALKSIRHFIVQISMEVEIHNGATLEADGDVCGIDMSQYSSSTAFQICELRLERFLPQLKQIVYAAEREAGILDQIQQIYAFWEDATFSMKISNQLWSISFPTNLDSLTRKARNHGEQMVGFDEHVDTMMGDVREKMRRWTEILEKLHNLLSDWSNLLHQWFRFASLMLEVGHEKILTAEFEFFRKCAKYFRMFDNFIQNRPIVVHILEEKKAAGWLRSVNRCLQSMIEVHLTEAFYFPLQRISF